MGLLDKKADGGQNQNHPREVNKSKRQKIQSPKKKRYMRDAGIKAN